MAKKKLNKQQRKEQRLRKAKQWLTTYDGSPKKMVKNYKKRFKVDTTCALNDLREIGVVFTQEYLDAVKQGEEERIRQKHLKAEKKKQRLHEDVYSDCDDSFSFIAGYTSGGAAYGTTWEDVGIDSELPFEEKVRLYYGDCEEFEDYEVYEEDNREYEMSKKKTKRHKMVDGKLLQMNKKFSNLKMKQRDKINGWIYEEYKKYVTEHEKLPNAKADEQIIDAVLDKINEADIWIPADEIVNYYRGKKAKFQKRMENEKEVLFKSYVSFYRSIIDQDRSAVVICNLEHKIIYMNPSAIQSYENNGGDKLIGTSILECHNEKSAEKIQEVVEWFSANETHNMVYTFYNEKQNKDVYMVALREKGKLIGYYEKHEYRDRETMKLYDLW